LGEDLGGDLGGELCEGLEDRQELGG